MAMNGPQMGDEIVAAIQSLNDRIRPEDLPIMKLYWEAIASAIVAHIQNNEVVLSQGSDPQGGTVDSTSVSVQ